MLPGTHLSDVYTDLNGLTDLRARARRGADSAVDGVARQFEGLMLQMMLKGMRQASGGDPLFDSAALRMYQDLSDRQLSLSLSARGGLGLADVLARQLRASQPVAAGQVGALRGGISTDPTHAGKREESGRFVADPEPLTQVGRSLQVPARNPAVTARTPATGEPPAAGAEADPDPVSALFAPVAKARPREFQSGFAGPEEFVSGLAAEARTAARRLGVPPSLLLAQAALESGWGRAAIRHADGSPAYNLFGIKAGGSWTGDRVLKTTIEYEDDIPVKRQAWFRAYGSYAESFEDFANLLTGLPRYRRAVAAAADPERFMREVQAAGYATDPRYAEKVLRIWRELPKEPLRLALGTAANQTGN